MFACNVIIMSLAMAQLSVANIIVTPNAELDAAKIDEMTAKVSGKPMEQLLKREKTAWKKFEERKGSQQAWWDALDDIRQVTVDALPQLLEFLVKDECLKKGDEQMKLAYICQMNGQRKPLKKDENLGTTLSSCLTDHAKSAEETALIKLFEAKLKIDGGMCGKLPKNENRPDGKLGTKFWPPGDAFDEYTKKFEKVAELFGNNARLATIKNDPVKKQAAGFFAELFHFGKYV